MWLYKWLTSSEAVPVMAVLSGLTLAILLAGSVPFDRIRPAKSLRQYRTAIVLLGVACVLLGMAALLVPAEPPVYTPGAYDLSVVTTTPTDSLQITVQSIREGLYYTSIELNAEPPTTGSRPPAADITITLPQQVQVITCTHPTCEARSGVGGTNQVLLHEKLTQSCCGATSWYADTTIPMTADRFAWDANGLNAEVQLPSVEVSPPPAAAKSGEASIAYSITNSSSYDWPGQVSVGPYATVWTRAISEASNSVAISAGNPAAKRKDDLLAFVAGALVGAGAGGVIAAVQEAMNVHTANDPSAAGGSNVLATPAAGRLRRRVRQQDRE